VEQTTNTLNPQLEVKESAKSVAVGELFDKKAKAAAPKTDVGQTAQADTPHPSPEKAPDSAAKQMALIAREAKRIAAEKEALRSEREAQKEQQAEYQRLKALHNKIKEDPFSALSDLGMDFDGLVKAVLNKREEDANPVIKKVRELEHKLSEKEKIEAEQAVKLAESHQRQLVAEHVGKIRTHIASNPEKYEFLSTYKAEQEVFDKIKEVFDASVKKDDQGRITSFKELTVEEACDMLESEYEESATQMAQIKKLQAKFAKEFGKSAAPTKEAPTKVESKAKSATLTNSMAGGEKPRPLTREERRERAFAALHGKLM